MATLREVCFCGCGAPRNKRDPTNLDGWLVVFELGPWFSYLRVMDAVGQEEERANTEQFTEDGRTVYQWVFAEVHEGVKRRRKQRKETERWRKFSEESREKISRFAESEGTPDPFDIEPPPVETLRAWALTGELPPVEDDED